MTETLETAKAPPKDVDAHTKPLWRTFLTFLAPMMLSNILQSLSGTINSVFLGHMIGVKALGAATQFFPIMFFLMAFVIGLGSGASVLIGQAYGKGDFEKVRTIAREIYRADDVVADKSVRDQLKAWEAAGYGKFPICMAKTQYSFSTDPNLKGAPTNHVLPVREVRLSAGAEFIVVICGDIMTMPGLPKVPSAEVIGLDEKGQIAGLF